MIAELSTQRVAVIERTGGQCEMCSSHAGTAVEPIYVLGGCGGKKRWAEIDDLYAGVCPSCFGAWHLFVVADTRKRLQWEAVARLESWQRGDEPEFMKALMCPPEYRHADDPAGAIMAMLVSAEKRGILPANKRRHAGAEQDCDCESRN